MGTEHRVGLRSAISRLDSEALGRIISPMRRLFVSMTAMSLFVACDASEFPDPPSDPETALPQLAATNGGSAAGSDARAPRSGPKRVVPLGDSITETSCTSQLLWKKLRDAGPMSFDLIGSRTNQQGCGVENPDRDCEGHSGYLVTDMVPGKSRASELAGWSSANRAEVVLMHFGTNDVWNNIPPLQIVQAFSEVVASLRRAQPNVIVLVAQILPMRPAGCPDCGARVQALNRQIPTWAAASSTPASPIYVVDHWTGFDVARHTYDGVHPNLEGARKMADAWFAALTEHQVL
jgi:lysophospholipase L1-like esterase